MSNRYKGGVISATPPTTTGGDTGTASGAWTLEQQMQAQAAGLWPSPPPPLYIEDVFSTYLYTGNGSSQTITNGINLSGKGGMVWVKARDGAIPGNIFDTVRNDGYLVTSTTSAVNSAGGGAPPTSGIYPFNSNGFTFADGLAYWNLGSYTYASWTFRKQPKFFDCVTYTGTGSNTGNNIAHSLGSLPGFLIFKATSTTSDWCCLAQNSSGNYEVLQLNTTSSSFGAYSPTTSQVTTTTFNPGRIWGNSANASGQTYVAYLFASNAGGFGLAGTDNVISCGSYAGSGAAQDISLGYEAQWVLVKNVTTAGWDWYVIDNMRGFVATPASPNFTKTLSPNTSGAESDQTAISPTATGFRLNTGAGAFNASGNTYIYITIRRGPMKTPTDGNKVLAVDISNTTGSATNPEFVSNFPVDMYFLANRANIGGVDKWYWLDRLRGDVLVNSVNTSAESSFSVAGFAFNTGVFNTPISTDYYATMFRRSPGFMDVVCYTGTGSATTVTHNLGAVPELMIVKSRSGTTAWRVYSSALLATQFLELNSTAAAASSTALWNSRRPSSSVFTVGSSTSVNGSSTTYVSYLFASAPGVSKVGSYTGTGAAQTINCGFTGGARFVLIKRTDSTGDWYVWDSTRGIIPSNDPYLLLNSTAAEVTGTDYVDTTSVGFEITSTAPAAINASGGTFIFLAIA